MRGILKAVGEHFSVTFTLCFCTWAPKSCTKYWQLVRQTAQDGKYFLISCFKLFKIKLLNFI